MRKGLLGSIAGCSRTSSRASSTAGSSGSYPLQHELPRAYFVRVRVDAGCKVGSMSNWPSPRRGTVRLSRCGKRAPSHRTVKGGPRSRACLPKGRDFNAGLFAFRLAVLLSWADSIGRAPFSCALVPSSAARRNHYP